MGDLFRRKKKSFSRRWATLHEASDAELMSLLMQGEERALDILIARYGTRIRKYLGHLVNNHTWADDLAQEVFVRVLERASTFDANYSFSIWLFRIARNLAVDLIRREDLRKTTTLADEAHLEPTALHAPTHSPLESLEQREFREKFAAALAQLPELFRSVFVLREMEGMSYEEIAEVVGASTKTVSTRLHRARGHLRLRLQRYLEGER